MNYDDVALRIVKDLYSQLSAEPEKVNAFYTSDAKLIVSFGDERGKCFTENRASGHRPGERHIFRCNALTQGDLVIAHVSGCVIPPDSAPLQSNEMLVFGAKIEPVEIRYHSVHLSQLDGQPSLPAL